MSSCNANGTWDRPLPHARQVCSSSIVVDGSSIVDGKFIIQVSGPCYRRLCLQEKECVVTDEGKAKCVCSASLRHSCLSDIMPICASNNMTFWSECDRKNYNPEEGFSILRSSACDSGPRGTVKLSTPSGVNTKYIYKCRKLDPSWTMQSPCE